AAVGRGVGLVLVLVGVREVHQRLQVVRLRRERGLERVDRLGVGPLAGERAALADPGVGVAFVEPQRLLEVELRQRAVAAVQVELPVADQGRHVRAALLALLRDGRPAERERGEESGPYEPQRLTCGWVEAYQRVLRRPFHALWCDDSYLHPAWPAWPHEARRPGETDRTHTRSARAGRTSSATHGESTVSVPERSSSHSGPLGEAAREPVAARVAPGRRRPS